MVRRLRRYMGPLAMLLLCPAVGGAQLVQGTGVNVTGGRDNRWTVSNDNGLTNPAGYVVTSPPSPPWQANVPGSFSWISVAASGSGGSGSYRASTQFTLGAGDALSLTFRCATDNSVLGIFVNGSAVAGATCGFWTFGAQNTLTSWLAGLNTLEVRWGGDRTTDGVALVVENVTVTPGTPTTPSVVPEPSTYALMLTGLGLLVLTRRRRTLPV